MTVEITGIEVRVGEKTFKMSIEEARELRQVLTEALYEQESPDHIEYPHHWYVPPTTTTPFPQGNPIDPYNPTYTEPMMIGPTNMK